LTGYGYGKTLLKQTSFVRILPYYGLAILLHAFYNFAVSFSVAGLALGLVVAFIVVITAIILIRAKITSLDDRRCNYITYDNNTYDKKGSSST
jgi:RsiW-degrading membrane proteinase PrsW (M82 family)